MKREIIFRGKTKDGEWVYGSLIQAGEYCCILQDEEKVDPMDFPYLDNETGCLDGYATPVTPETVGQFTGLYDKNDKKIFKGDIVKVVYTEKRDYQGVKYDDEFEMIETVIYYEKHACFMLEINNEGITMFRPLHDFESKARIKSVEVIGNIHDNPELLEVQE